MNLILQVCISFRSLKMNLSPLVETQKQIYILENHKKSDVQL